MYGRYHTYERYESKIILACDTFHTYGYPNEMPKI